MSAGPERRGKAPVLVALAVSAILYAPVFVGRVPFPAGILQQIPATSTGAATPAGPRPELGDLVTQMYPFRSLLAETWRRGEVPLWNSRILFGAPFAADLQSACFHPLSVLYLLLPVPVAWALAFPLRTALAGVFTVALARRLGASDAGAAAAALAYALSGYMIGWQGWPLADAGVWLPALLLAVDRLWEMPSLSRTGQAALLLAMPVLAGAPEVAVLVTLAAMGLAAWRLAAGPRPPGTSRARFASSFAGAAILAGGLAAVQLSASFEWLPRLARSLDGIAWTPRPLGDALTLLSRDAAHNPSALGFEVPDALTYVGVGTLVAAALAAAGPRRRDAAFLVLLALAAAQIVYSRGPVAWIWSRLPLLRSLVPDRAVVLLELSLALLAGLGLTAVTEPTPSPPVRGRTPRALLGLTAAGVAAGLAGLAVTRARTVPILTTGLLGAALTLAAAISLLAAALRTSDPLRRRKLAWAFAAVSALDLLTFAWGAVPFVPRAEVFPETPALRRIRERETGLDRTAFLDITAPMNVEMVLGLHAPTGYDYVLRDVQQFLAPFTGDEEGRMFSRDLRAGRVATAPDRRLDLMGVRTLAANTFNGSAAALDARPDRFRFRFEEGGVRVYENASALPRAFLVPREGVEVLPDELRVRVRLADPAFDPSASALLVEPPAWPWTGAHAPAAGLRDRIEAFRPGENAVEMTAETARPALVVLTDLHYPGWRAFVDGRPQPLLRADGIFRAVALAPGRHAVRFSYEPGWLGPSVAITLAALSLVALLEVRAWLARRRPSLVQRLDEAVRPALVWVIAPLAAYFALFALLSAPALLYFRTHFLGDGYDGIQNAWNLWWVRTALARGLDIWFTPYLFHPEGVTLVAHTLNPFNGLLTALFGRALSPVESYNVVVVFSFVASGYTCFLLAHALCGRYGASLFAGAAFTFGSYHWAHADGHMQLISMEWVPLFLLAWVRWLERATPRRAAAAAGALLLVTLCDYYYAFYCGLAAAFLLAWETVRRRRPLFALEGGRARSLAVFALLAGATSGVLAGALYLRNAIEPFAGFHDPADASLDLFALFVPGEHWRFAELTAPYWTPLPGGGVEASVYLGWTVIAVAAFALAARPRDGRPGAARWLVLALAFFLLALGPRLQVRGTALPVTMPYAWLVKALPFLQISGVPLRMASMVLLATALLAALGFAEFRRVVLRTRLATALFLVLFLLDVWPSPLPLTPFEVPDYVRALAAMPPGAVHLPFDNGAEELLQQTVFDKPATVGYIARTPAALATRRDELDLLVASRRYDVLLRSYGVRYLVMDDDGAPEPPRGLKRVYRGAVRSVYVRGDDPLPAAF